MKKVGHIIFAGILTFLFVYLMIYLGFSLFELNLKNIGVIAILVSFYSILPDIDHKNSSITWWFFGIGLFFLIFGILGIFFKLTFFNPLLVVTLSASFLAIVFVSSNIFKHRGLIHTVQAGIIAVFPTYLIFHSLIFPLLAYIAWHSHLLGDGYFFKIK
jgi:hypothetical protein